MLCSHSAFLIASSCVQLLLSSDLSAVLTSQSVTVSFNAAVSLWSVCMCQFVIFKKLSDLALFIRAHFSTISSWSESVWCSVSTVQHSNKLSLQMMSVKFIIKIFEMILNQIKTSESFFIKNSKCFINAFSDAALLHVLTWEFQKKLCVLKFSNNKIQFWISFI